MRKKKPLPNEQEAQRMLNEIERAADSLQKTINTEIENRKLTKLTETDLATLKTLQMQVESAIKDGFKNELDTWRWQQWGEFKPLTEDNLVPGTGEELGVGAQGSVFKYELDPALRKSPVVVKYDSNGLNGDAITAGIPELNPQQSVRAVAAFKMSKQLNLDIIPPDGILCGN